MNRGFAARVWLVVAAVGCQAPPKLVEPFPEPSRASGSWVVIEDRRPGWEKQPFTGPAVSLYRFSRVSPNPWVRLQKATEAVVAELPERPERVDVVVASFRLTSKEDSPAPQTDEGGAVQVGGRNATAFGKGPNGVSDALAYERARSAAASGDRGTAQQAAGALAFGQNAPAGGVQLGAPPVVEGPEGPLDGLTPGAHCTLRGVVRLTYPGGKDKDVPFTVLAGRPNETGSRYWGETLEEATKLALVLFTRQVRQGVGLPPGE